ncbi:MAG TPA: c-type cytochrome biogenesis protein CcmI [Pyrinomonadaceae bacterium]|nr:c-type cytochrome biogenesis protein CcmI [Pyrinomonadaceae bacterium]
MITFWLICGVFILIALAFVLPPLFQTETHAQPDESGSREANITVYKDQLSELEADLRNGIIATQQYEQDRDEIQRRLLEDLAASDIKQLPTKPLKDERVGAYALAIAIPVLAIGLYLKIGNINAQPAQPAAPPPTSTSENSGGMSQAQIEANVAALAKRLETNPSDLQGWTMLARSYSMLEKYDDSSKAYEKAVALKPRDVELISNYAFTLAMASGGRFAGRPLELIKQALEIDPENPTVLGLAGGAAFEQKYYKQAIEYWTKLLQNVPADSEMAQAVNEKLKEARSLAK